MVSLGLNELMVVTKMCPIDHLLKFSHEKQQLWQYITISQVICRIEGLKWKRCNSIANRLEFHILPLTYHTVSYVIYNISHEICSWFCCALFCFCYIIVVCGFIKPYSYKQLGHRCMLLPPWKLLFTHTVKITGSWTVAGKTHVWPVNHSLYNHV